MVDQKKALISLLNHHQVLVLESLWWLTNFWISQLSLSWTSSSLPQTLQDILRVLALQLNSAPCCCRRRRLPRWLTVVCDSPYRRGWSRHGSGSKNQWFSLSGFDRCSLLVLHSFASLSFFTFHPHLLILRLFGPLSLLPLVLPLLPHSLRSVASSRPLRSFSLLLISISPGMELHHALTSDFTLFVFHKAELCQGNKA